MSCKRFVGKNVLITGAASGIGKATAERLAGEGANLLLADLNEDGVAVVAETLAKAHGVTTRGIAFDAGQAASCRQMVGGAVEIFDGRLDALCNIAGIMDWGPFDTFGEERWDRMMRINLNSLFHINQAALPSLIESKGNIVNMASASGLMGIAYTTAYCVAKAGVIAMTKSLAVEFAAKGVRINAVAPGGVKTPMNGSVPLPDGVDMGLLQRLWPKLGDLCEADEIAAGVAYLACNEARNITGTVLVIDGGQTAG
ncbi:MAG: SDR family oxidoreductase [Proteobacteria bacterium]|nr:SDR family oxidoreductase [Pseudomonadota bacterium]HQR03073.1 SDR family NAD(P)-dependent oxidoreductase [Rhodocyclaceae bacterium]